MSKPPVRIPPHIRIRRSSRAKRLRLTVKPGLIELVLPQGMPESQALTFFDKHRPWAEEKLLEMNQRAASMSAFPGFTSNPTLPWRGREIPLLIHEEPGIRAGAAVVDDAMRIVLPEGMGEARDQLAKRALYTWVRNWLRPQAALLTQRHAPLCGLYPREIRIKAMKTRWGSCGPKSDLNLNWLLAFAPEGVLEYVVVHELCHIRERNHSPAFWSLVAHHFPEYVHHRRWLRAHGTALMHRFGF